MSNYENIKKYLEQELNEEQIKQINSLKFFKPKSRYDITGKKFNELTVLGKGPNRGKFGQWWCLCSCGNIVLVRHSNLTSNNTKSCGCLKIQSSTKNIQKAIQNCKLDLTNQKFGLLIAIKPTELRNNNSVVWECKCDCGKIHYASAKDLKAEKITSCGCQKFVSKGCRLIEQILNDNNINYEKEKVFETCRFPDTNNMARFDFYIENKFLLEFDGIQHFQDKNPYYFRDSLKKRQEHDKFKDNWCLQNQIPLKRIPYTDLKQISLENIMGDKYLIKN